MNLAKATTFKIHFPRVNVAAEPIQEPSQAEGVAGSETILIVEDDPNLRHIGVESVKSEGYKVLEAHDAKEAIEIVKNNTGPIHLLLTDVVMPGMNGVELFGILKELCTGLRAVFMSGYAGDSIRTQLASIPDLVLLKKPFSRSSLLSALRRALQTAPP